MNDLYSVLGMSSGFNPASEFMHKLAAMPNGSADVSLQCKAANQRMSQGRKASAGKTPMAIALHSAFTNV